MQFFPPSRAIAHFGSANCPVAYQGLKIITSLALRFPDFQRARVRYAALLARQTHLPLLVSGGKVFKTSVSSEAVVMAAVLNNEYQLPVRWQEPTSRNTAENAIYTHKILSKQGIQSIILVTHALHMRRAVEQFQLQGFSVLPAPTVFLSRTEPLDLLSFLPSARALERSTSVIHEIMGCAWYKLRY